MVMARQAVLLCGLAAMTLGLGYMVAGGAPPTYLLMNSAASAIAVAIVVILSRQPWRASAGAVCLGLTGLLLTSFLFGTTANGATRWLRLGNIIIQPSLILLPVLILTFANARNWAGAAGVTLAAIVLALQPDRAMSGALAAGALILAVMRPDPRTLTAVAAALTGFAAAMVQPDTQGAMPFVDRILLTSFDVHPAAGVAVISGSLILLMPAITGIRKDPPAAPAYAVFGAVWLALVVAAALGNYPTPLVGYGGSAILGYLLCSLAFQGQAAAFRSGRDRAATTGQREERGGLSLKPV